MLKWHFFLSPVSFSFLRMNLSTSDFRVSHLLADSRPLTLFPSRQCSMLQSAAINIGHKVHFNAVSHLSRCNKCDCESSHQVCLYMLWCGNIVLWSITLFYVTMFTTLTPLGWFFHVNIHSHLSVAKDLVFLIFHRNPLTGFSCGT